ncbi:rlpA-like double-psi beta-barrel domain-containing protein [Artemisia annua]|uniref:RlpA-like double-psi beta-barrel domain-containing protein n=1 Tax=Artemisia annua TaxID=35608 RepID=A0A2U1LQV4_ARTAN|nr:rlpA-like double-psi beta-barrel domain-containing protein [Artemisia annua]
MAMGHLQHLQFFIPFFLLFTIFLHPSHAEVGTSAQYSPPFLPTACYGYDSGQFPSSNLFAAAGDGIWDNGAACGRQYLVKCISATEPGTCVVGQVIQVRIVDFALTSVSPPSLEGTTMVLSDTAFGTIANSTAKSINIEFQQYV